MKKLDVHETETFRCLFDVLINFKGKIAVQIGTRLRFRNYPQLQVKLIINEFRCPIRVCFTPFSLGKSYASLLEHPALDL